MRETWSAVTKQQPINDLSTEGKAVVMKFAKYIS